MNKFVAVALILFFVAVMGLSLFGHAKKAHDADCHEKAVKHTVAFGKQHTYDFVLKKGTSLKVQSEVGELILCLPEDGQPTILVSPNGTQD